MRVYTKVIIDIATGVVVESDSYNYAGPVALCGGSDSATTSQTVYDTDTTSINVQGVEGPAITSSPGARVTQIETDHAAVREAFDFGSGALSEVGRSTREAFDFGAGALENVERFGSAALSEVGRAGREAFSFSDAALGEVSSLANRALDAASRFARESLGLVERTATQAQQSFESALGSTLQNLDEEQSGGAQRVLVLAIAGFAAIALLAFMRR